jgi:hypothetical protein
MWEKMKQLLKEYKAEVICCASFLAGGLVLGIIVTIAAFS